jgi:hypothetical protein
VNLVTGRASAEGNLAPTHEASNQVQSRATKFVPVRKPFQ